MEDVDLLTNADARLGLSAHSRFSATTIKKWFDVGTDQGIRLRYVQISDTKYTCLIWWHQFCAECSAAAAPTKSSKGRRPKAAVKAGS